MHSLKVFILLLALVGLNAKGHVSKKYSCEHDKHTTELSFVDVPVDNVEEISSDASDSEEESEDGHPLDGGNGDGQLGEESHHGHHHHNKKNKDKSNRKLQSSYPNMRIYANYDSLTGTPEFKAYIQNELVPSVINFLQKLLKTKYPVSGLLKLPSYQTTVCGFTTPQALLTGVATDLALLVAAFNDTATSTIAYAGACSLQATVNRPIIGQVNFNMAAVKVPNGDPLIHEDNLVTTLHEITHVLGFSSSLFPYYVDATGKKRTGHILSKTVNGKTYSVVNVEPLTTVLRAHFGCSTLEGAYLENQGGSGSAGSHFERRFFGYEYMTSSIVDDMRISNFTLALLEGSGWYVPDYSVAEPMYFGQGEGCNFITGSCANSGTPTFDEFCATNSFGCSPTGRIATGCNPYDTFADGCSWYAPVGQIDCENPAALSGALLKNYEFYGSDTGSRCFTGNLAQSYSFTGAYGYCFKYNCEGQGLNTVLKVNIGSQNVTCAAKGSITVSGLTGKLNCPDPLSFCNTIARPFCKRGCMGNGVCVNNKCQCNVGWKGSDCGQKV